MSESNATTETQTIPTPDQPDQQESTIEAPEQEHEEMKAYLLKKTKHGKWQKRWFETNGCFLTYYKREGQKLLAALNLSQVGEIQQLPEDNEDGDTLFTIELNERVYTIKAQSRDEAKEWVDGLRLRQEGKIEAAEEAVETPVAAENVVADISNDKSDTKHLKNEEDWQKQDPEKEKTPVPDECCPNSCVAACLIQ